MTMYKTRWTAAMAGLGAAVILGLLVSVSLAAPPPGKGGGGGNGGGGDPPPDLPDVAFEVSILPVADGTSIEDCNSSLQIVGFTNQTFDGVEVQEGFVYEHDTGVVMTLPDLISETELASLVSRGYTNSKFRGINDFGLLVGYAANADYSSADGLIINLATGALTLTSTMGYEDSYLLHVNNSGDLVGGYLEGDEWRNGFVAAYDAGNQQANLVRELGAYGHITFASQLTDSGLVLLRDDQFNTWEYDIATDILLPVSNDSDGVILQDIDSSGLYAGEFVISKGNRADTFPVTFDPTLGITWQSEKKGSVSGMNDPSLQDLADGVAIGDVVFLDRTKEGRNLILRNPVLGELKIDDLIHPEDPNRDLWLLFESPGGRVMTEKRPDTNFGAIAGTAGGVPFLLIPEPYVRN